jgi:hypothetical protein
MIEVNYSIERLSTGGYRMKSQDKQKGEEKKKPGKTLKEKRAEKKAKKDSKTSQAE